jgi:hypothetical protein
MNTDYTDQSLLKELLRKARMRRQLLLSLRGAAISLGVVAVVLLVTGWAAHRYRYNGNALIVLRTGAVLMVITTIYFALLRPLLQRISDTRLARLIEERSPGTEDRLVTAVEFANDDASRVSPALVGRLYRDANSVSATLDVRNVIRQSRLLMYGGAALASLLLFAGVLKWGPREISEGVAQLVTPTTMAASSNAMAIKVKPGSARVPKGSDQDILATLVNFDSQNVTVYTRPLGSKDDFQGQVMEPAKARSDFRFSIFNIQHSVEYFVESNTIRSEVYKLNVVDLPYVKQLDLTLNFPAFTNLPTKTVEDGGDIAALKGTVATITARLSGKVRAARIVFADGKKTDMRMQGNDFVGEISVAADTSYYIELVSNDGEAYRGSNEYDVSVLSDQPPVISFDKPGRDKKATNLEEVFTQARAEDDYGVVSMDLHFSVNGGEEKKVNLQQLTRESARSLSGAYTFFLEEYNLKPGDFISYYAKARDAANESTSDIYFIEVKPFEMEYKQSQQQGGGGGEGGDQEQNALSRRQKDLIAATHRLIREGDKYTEQERKDGYEAVATGQEKLRTDTLEFLDRMGRRLGDVEGQKQVAEMAEHLKQAAKEMEGAPPPLRKEAGKDALPPEQRALQRLLAADAIFREVQVAFGNQSSSGGGGGGQREQQELSGLFELELDKMKNQYETVQRAQQQRAEQQKSEAERRLEELARRQQQALEEQRRRAQQAANGGGGGNQRQQQEMIEETRKAARELERLSRERRDAQMQELSRQLNQTADEMQKAQASSRNNPNESIAQNERALDRLRQAQERLQQMNGATGQRGGQPGSSGRQQQISDLRQRAAQAASRQREIAKDMESLSRRGGQNAQDENSRKAREQLAERKDTLADSVNNLRQDIEQSARAMGAGQGQGQQRAARQLKEAADGLARDRVADRIREGKQALNGQQSGQQGQQGGQQSQQQGNQQGAGRTDERAIERSLNNLSERLQAAEQSARGANASSAEENLDRTRQLADNLDSLRRRLDENSRRGKNGQQQQSNQQGQQPGQQQGQQGQRGQQGQSGQQGQKGQQGQEGRGQQGQQGREGSQHGSQQAGGSQNGGQSDANRQRGGIDPGGTMGGDWGDNRQLPAEIRERLREAQDLRREWGQTGMGAGRLDEVIEELKRLADGKMEGDAATASHLKAEVVEPLRQLELELSRLLQQQSGRTNLRLRDEGAAPEKYRKAVEEYYRRLSGARQRQ